MAPMITLKDILDQSLVSLAYATELQKKEAFRRWLWRGLSLFLLLMIFLSLQRHPGSPSRHDYIGRLELVGSIDDDPVFVKRLRDLANDKHLKGLWFYINCPGGTATAGEAILEAVTHIRKSGKPVAAAIAAIGASGGYMVAMGSERIVAQPTSMVGSIGTVIDFTDVSKLVRPFGIESEPIASGQHKAALNPLMGLTPEQKQRLRNLILASHYQFTYLVSIHRHLSLDYVQSLADGSVWTGQQAKLLGLVDELGGEDKAYAWLTEVKKLDASLPVETIQLFDQHEPDWLEYFLHRLSSAVSSSIKQGFLSLARSWLPTGLLS
jgi:protease-4